MLAVQDATGSPSAAGFALAAFAVGSSVLAPVRGRLVDRIGARRALPPMALTSGAALLAMAAVDDPVAMAALAGVAGLSVPPLIASARVVWPLVVPEERLGAAYGVQALLGDLGNVAGPALAGGFAAAASTSAGLVACAVLPAAGVAVLVTLPWREAAAETTRAGALGSRAIQALVAAEVALGLGLGSLDVGLAADLHASAAVPLAAFAAASAVASLWYGGREHRHSAERRYLLGALALAVSLAPLALAGTAILFAVILVPAGVAFAAVNVAVYELLDRFTPEGSGAEAFTWLTTAGAAGTAVGAVAAGQLAAAGGPALLVPCVGAALAAVAVLVRPF